MNLVVVELSQAVIAVAFNVMISIWGGQADTLAYYSDEHYLELLRHAGGMCICTLYIDHAISLVAAFPPAAAVSVLRITLIERFR